MAHVNPIKRSRRTQAMSMTSNLYLVEQTGQIRRVFRSPCHLKRELRRALTVRLWNPGSVSVQALNLPSVQVNTAATAASKVVEESWSWSAIMKVASLTTLHPLDLHGPDKSPWEAPKSHGLPISDSARSSGRVKLARGKNRLAREPRPVTFSYVLGRRVCFIWLLVWRLTESRLYDSHGCWPQTLVVVREPGEPGVQHSVACSQSR